jgi:hypothetical protein
VIEKTGNTAIDGVLRGFKYEHLSGALRSTSEACAELAVELIHDIQIPLTPETTVGLRKLLEAKDAFVRSVVYAIEDNPPMEDPPDIK